MRIQGELTAHPTAEWVWRQLIAPPPWGNQLGYLLRDRDRSYGGAFIPRAAYRDADEHAY